MRKEGKEIKTPLIFSRILFSNINPLELHKKTASIFGLGGLGVLVAEMLARMGIGKLILVDRDIVRLENLNRLGYSIEDLNKPKVEALAKKLEGIRRARENFGLEIETYFVDIIAWDGLEDVIKRSDIVFSCLDNLDARLEINRVALKYKKPLVDGGTSLNGLRGRITVVIPFETPCLACYYDENTLLDRENEEIAVTCGASLPTTMSIVASLQVDQGVKILLGRKNLLATRIFINLEDDIYLSVEKHAKKRRDCSFCSLGGANDR